MGPPAAVQGIIFNSIKAGVDIEVPKMRMQLRMNQYRAQRRVAATAKIFETQVRDATIVRRAVALGLPVILVGQETSETDNVLNDFRRLALELNKHGEIL
jgi:chromosome partitioning protein